LTDIPLRAEPCPCGKGEYVVLECMPDRAYPRGQTWRENGTTCAGCAANYGVSLLSLEGTIEIAVKQLMGDKRETGSE